MTPELSAFLDELAAASVSNDAPASGQAGQMLSIRPETGPFLVLLLRALAARQVLEVGTGNGYGTLWLAQGVRELDGLVTTLEHRSDKVLLARQNFERTGLAPWICQETRDAGDFLQEAASARYRFILLNGEPGNYLGWWPAMQRVLAPGGMVVVEKAEKASSQAGATLAFAAAVAATPGYISSLVPLGNGEMLILKV